MFMLTFNNDIYIPTSGLAVHSKDFVIRSTTPYSSTQSKVLCKRDVLLSLTSDVGLVYTMGTLYRDIFKIRD